MFCLHFEQSRRFKGRFKTHAMCCIIYKLLQGNAGEKSRDTSQGLLSLWKQSESVINVIRDSLGISGSLCGHIFSASPLEVLFFLTSLYFLPTQLFGFNSSMTCCICLFPPIRAKRAYSTVFEITLSCTASRNVDTIVVKVIL